MKFLLVILFCFLIASCTKEIVIYNASSFTHANKTELIADTTVNGVWDGGGKVLTINNFKIHGTGTLQNWDIDASVNQVLFDTSINLKNITTAKTPFSTKWYDINKANPDNWWNIQKSMNVCIANGLVCYTPGTGYNYSKTLEAATIVNGAYQFTKIVFTGDASYWEPSTGKGTSFNYTGLSGPAFNFQLNKGSKISQVVFNGRYVPPGGVDSVYFNLTEAQFTDQSGLKFSDNYCGVTIDFHPPLNGTTRSGSTGIEMTDISINAFAKGLAFSQNGITQNDDAHVIDKIHFTNDKWCIVTGQPQEKGNSINHIYSWGSSYNILKHFGAGNYTFDVANIAGRCIEPVQAQIGHWFSSSISNWFCESTARVCAISASMPFTFKDCVFDLNANFSKQRIVVNANSEYVNFQNCTIRYYDGGTTDVWVLGSMTWLAPNYFGGGNLIYK